jgi:hypothetical protein
VQLVADIVQCGCDTLKVLRRNDLIVKPRATDCNRLILLILLVWLAALDDFRNWLTLGLQPAKSDENR